MKRVIIVLGNVDTLPKFDCDVIGVDYGALVLAKQNVQMVCAIGDFDSVDGTDEIANYAKEVISLPRMKNETDCEAAILWALDKYDCMDIYGGLGGRLDHEFANMALLMQRKYPITFYNETNKIYRLDSGKHILNKEGYEYISFFPLKESVISLSGVKYSLSNVLVNVQDIYMVSNEILNDKMIIELEGEVLVFQSNDTKKHCSI